MKKVVILGIDNFSYKNIYQVACLNNNHFQVCVFTNNVLKNSSKNLTSENILFVLEKTFLKRIKQIYTFLNQNKVDIHHVEIYPGGRFSFIYLILAKLCKKKTIIVERGDMCSYPRMNKMTQISMRICYKYSDIVWYRESYKDLDVKEQLLSWGAKEIFFIPNAAPDINFIEENKSSQYLFLWANRLLKERKIKWFINSINILKSSKSIILGVRNDNHVENDDKYALENKSEYLNILEYQNPKEYYLKSKFFVFPSDVVFLNNALLEAMSYGLVPLISNVQGARLIVDDGISGFVFEHTEDGLKKAMEDALNLTDKEYAIMSKNAIKKVKENFSLKVWSEKYLDMIERV